MGFGEEPRIHILCESDPDAVETALYGLAKLKAPKPSSFEAIGSKREIARAALAKLNEQAPQRRETVPLAAGAPYGRIRIDTEGCTLCLACVGACPAGALLDNPDLPQVRFIEAACVQCGLCTATCPEKVITLEPRYTFTPDAMTPQVLNEEEPFPCVRCGKPIAARSTIKRISAQLAGKHAMFMTADRAKLIEMCDDCRIVVQAEAGDELFAFGSRPMVRTTEDYFSAEKAAASNGDAALKAEDFLKDD
jgi:ferredoxin